jgi:hypothetical protein
MSPREVVGNLSTADEREFLNRFRDGFRSPFPYVEGTSLPMRTSREVLGFQLHRFIQENPMRGIVTDTNDEGSLTTRDVLHYALAGETALNIYEGKLLANPLTDSHPGVPRIQLITFFNNLPEGFEPGSAVTLPLSASATTDTHIGNSYSFGSLIRYISPEDYRIIEESARTFTYNAGMGLFDAVALHPAVLLVSSLSKAQMRQFVPSLEPTVTGFPERVMNLLKKGEVKEWVKVAGATARSLSCHPDIQNRIYEQAVMQIGVLAPMANVPPLRELAPPEVQTDAQTPTTLDILVEPKWPLS